MQVDDLTQLVFHANITNLVDVRGVMTGIWRNPLELPSMMLTQVRLEGSISETGLLANYTIRAMGLLGSRCEADSLSDVLDLVNANVLSSTFSVLMFDEVTRKAITKFAG